MKYKFQSAAQRIRAAALEGIKGIAVAAIDYADRNGIGCGACKGARADVRAKLVKPSKG